MKRKIILTLIMSAMLLTACRAEGQSINTAKTTAETASETENTDEEITEAENSSNLKMRFFDFKSVNPEAGDYSATFEYISYSNSYGDNFIVPCDYDGKNTVTYIYDLNENTLVDKFEPAKDWSLKDTIDDSMEILYKGTLYEWVGDSQEDAVYTIYLAPGGFTYTTAEYTIENNWVQHYDRKISEWNLDLVDAETGEVLIKAYNPPIESEYIEEYGYDTSVLRYQFPLDEKQFVYQTSGVQALACIGVYDLEKNEAREIPNSADFKPLGVRDGKIYLADGLWNSSSDKVKILTADPDTLETEVFMEWSKGDDTIEFIMSEDGKYIAVSYSNSQRIYVINTDTKEMFNAIVEEKYDTLNPISFADNDTIVIPNWAGKLLLIDITE